MCKVIAKLIRNGHAKAWEYGWSFTEIALKEIHESQQQYQRDISVAINMAFADQKTLNNFLNPKPEKDKKEDDDGLGEWKRLANTLNSLGK